MSKRNPALDLKQNYFPWNDYNISKRIFEKILREEEHKLRKTMCGKKTRQSMDQLLSYPTIIIKKFDSLSTIDCCTLRDNCSKNNKSTANFTHDDDSIKNKESKNNKYLKNKKNQFKITAKKSICNNNEDLTNNSEELKLFKKRNKSEDFENMILKKYKKRKKINRSPVSTRKMNLQLEELFKYGKSSNDIHEDQNINFSLKSPKAEAIQKIFKVKLVEVCENSNGLKNSGQKQEPKSIHEEETVLENKENKTVIESKKKKKRKSIDSGIESTPPQEMVQDLNEEQFEIDCGNNNSKRRKSKSSINIMELEERIKKFKEELKLVENNKNTKRTKSLTSLSDVSDDFLVEKNNNNIDSVMLMTKKQYGNASDATVIPDNQRLDDVKLDRNIYDEVKILMQSIVNGFSSREPKSDNCRPVVSPDFNIINISTDENESSLTNVISKNETVNKLNLSTNNNLDIFEQSPSQLVEGLDTIKEKRIHRRKNTVVIKKNIHPSKPLNSAVLTSASSSAISIPPAPDLVSNPQTELNAPKSTFLLTPAASTVTDQGNKSIASVLPLTFSGTVEQSSTLTVEPPLLYQSCSDCVPNTQYLRESDQGNIILNSQTGQQNDNFDQNGIFLYDRDIKTIIHCILEMRVFNIKLQSNSLINHTQMNYIMNISETAVSFMKKLASHLNITSWRILMNKIAVYSRTTGLCKPPILENELNEIIHFYINHFRKKNNMSQIPSQEKTRPIMHPVAPDVAISPGIQAAGAMYSNGVSPNAVVPGSHSYVGNQFGPCTTPISSSRHALQPNPYGFHETFNYCNSPSSQPLYRYSSTNTTTDQFNIPIHNIQITNDQIIALYCQIQIYNQLVKRTKEIIFEQRILLAQKIQAEKTFSAKFHDKILVNQERTEVSGIVRANKKKKQEQIHFNLEKAKKKKNLHSILDKILEKKTCSNENKQDTCLSHKESVDPNLIQNQKIIKEENYIMNSSIGIDEFMEEKLEFSDINKEMIEELSSSESTAEPSLLTTPIITAVFSIPYDNIDVIDENAKEIEDITG